MGAAMLNDVICYMTLISLTSLHYVISHIRTSRLADLISQQPASRIYSSRECERRERGSCTMSVLDKVMQAIRMKMMLNRLSQAKENAMRDFLGLPPRLSWYEECSTTVMTCIKDKFCQVVSPCCLYDRNRRKKRPKCWGSPTFSEFLGFVGGVLLTAVLYLLLVYQVSAPPRIACLVCAGGGLLITIVTAFSVNARSILLLVVPQFFSGKGRMFLLMYALFLVMNHPVKNFNANIIVMSESATCGQQLALNQTKELISAAVAPIQGVMDGINQVLKKLQDFASSLRRVYQKLGKTVSQIGDAVQSAGEWVYGLVAVCNEKFGEPYRTCKHIFDSAEDRCNDELGFWGEFVCWIPGLVGKICNIVRVGELLCIITAAITDLLYGSVHKPVRSALQSAKDLFYFRVEIDYHYNYTMVQSKSYTQVKDDIANEIKASMHGFMNAIGLVQNVMLFAMAFILIKALVYRFKYLSNDRYDNTYVTYTVRDVDERRKERGKPGILPLNYDEEKKYVKSNSMRMTRKEIAKLAFGLMFFFISVFNAGFYLLCDYGLYSVLALVKKHFSIKTATSVPAHTKLHVIGYGPMADMYRSVFSMFDPIANSNIKVNTAPCVPNPSEPDWAIYEQIGLIFFVCLVLTITEAYGLRLRHMVMGCYFPRRERMRALWLFNHILKTRGGVLQNAKKRIKARQQGDLDVEHISLKGQLAARFPFIEWLLKWLGWEVKSCLYCGREGKPDDYTNFVHCAYYDCDAIYCIECFADLDNVCTVCTNAVELSWSDVTGEIDSSIDEMEQLYSQRRKKKQDDRVKELQHMRSPGQVMANFRQTFGIPEGDAAFTGGQSQQSESSPDSSVNVNVSANYKSARRRQGSVYRGASRHVIRQTRRRHTRLNVNVNANRGDTSDCREDSDTDSDSQISDCSSVDTSDLEFDYQEHKDFASLRYSDDDVPDESAEYRAVGPLRVKNKLDLAQETIFSPSDIEDSSSSSSDDEVETLREPRPVRMFRS